MPRRGEGGAGSAHLFSSADLPAAVAITSAISPSSPEHGLGLLLMRQSTKASDSCTYASSYRLMKKSNGMSALPVYDAEKILAVFG